MFFTGCSDKEDRVKIPDNVLSEEKYIKLLVDFSLAESAGNLNVKNLSGVTFDSAYAFNPLKENNISRAQYDTTIAFYSKHPRLYKKIFEEVLTTLSKMQASRKLVKKDSAIKKDTVPKNILNDTVSKIKTEIKKVPEIKKEPGVQKVKLKKDKIKKSKRKKKKKKN